MNNQSQINPITNPINNTLINNIIKSNRGRKSTKKVVENKDSSENVKTLYDFYNIKPIKNEGLNNSNTNNEIVNPENITPYNNTQNNEETFNNEDINTNINSNINNKIDLQEIAEINEVTDLIEQPQKVYKKRGRKPKGGKIIKQQINVSNEINLKKNIILHLKCSINDINNNIFETNQYYNPNIVENIGGFSFNDKELSYDYVKSKEIVESETIIYSNNIYTNNLNNKSNNFLNTNDNVLDISKDNFNNTNNYIDLSNQNKNINVLNNTPLNSFNQSNTINQSFNKNNNQNKQINYYDEEENNNFKDIWKKLSELEYSLHNNDTSDKKSNCFWDTCEFDNPPIYIPKYELNGAMHVYGCFCSPECAVAFLMKENIDTTTKFERYHLLNHIYCKIYNYEKNIKPAPLPYYTLNKYYGNLTIQEYRKLLKNERLLLIVDKPLTRQLPELHQDNDDYIMNNSIQSCSKYKLRRRGTKQSKNEILNENFGLCK